MILSATDLSSYDYCSRKLFLEKILGIRAEIPKSVLVKGSIRHSAYEEIVKKEQEIVLKLKPEDKGNIEEKYRKEYSQILSSIIIKNKSRLRDIEMPLQEAFSAFWPSLLLHAKERAKIAEDGAAKGIFGEQLWESITPKLKAEYRIQSESLRLRGIIDRLEIFPTKIVPVEIKTGKNPLEGVWPGHKLQVGVYLLLLQEQFENTKEAVVHYVDSDKKVSIMLNPFLRDEVMETAQKVRELLGGKEVPSRISNEKKCKACGLYDKCYNDNLVNETAVKKGINY